MASLTNADSRIAIEGWQDLAHMPQRDLRGWEKVAVPFFTWLNTSPLPKAAFSLFVRFFTRVWVMRVTHRRIRWTGLENLDDINPQRGVLLVANHRSFFDMFVAIELMLRRTTYTKKIYFPVRSGFFYETLLGQIMNLWITGGSMWPPVFRDRRNVRLNPIGMRQMMYVLGVKGSVLGYHPEGTRNKSEDPWSYLPAKSGLGHLVKGCHPDTVIIPYFVGGIKSDFWDELRRNWGPREKRGVDVRIRWGKPFRVGEMDLNTTPKQISQDLLEVVKLLGEEDKATEAARGDMPGTAIHRSELPAPAAH